MSSAMSSRGGNRGGNRASRGVFPLFCTQSIANREQCEAGWTRRQFVPTAISAATYWPSLGAALFAARTDVTLSARRSMAVPWRERPRDLTGSAIMSAATAGVAHATVQVCHRLRRRLPTARRDGRDLDGIQTRAVVVSDRLPTLVSDAAFETADAARGAATKGGGWRSSVALSCSSKPVGDEPVCLRTSLASLCTSTTCRLRGRTTNAAFYAAQETHLAGVTGGAGA